MKRVLVFGTFDSLHPGHVSFLKQARRTGSWLIASVARDSYVRKYKNREPIHHEGERLTGLLKSGLVNEAHYSDESVGSYAIVDRVKPDLICLGHDQNRLHEHLVSWLSSRDNKIPIRVMKPHHPDRYKSSKLIKPQREAE